MRYSDDTKSFTCASCGGTFRTNPAREGTACLVYHSDDSCCHYSHTRVTDLATFHPGVTIDQVKSALPSIDLLQYLEEICGLNKPELATTKRLLQAYIDTKCREARVDELESIPLDNRGSGEVWLTMSLDERNRRIAELSKDQEGK